MNSESRVQSPESRGGLRGALDAPRDSGRWPLAFLAAAILSLVALASCIDLSTDPDEIVAIEFPVMPLPAVVAGDTLRDATGAVAPLAARLIDASGDEVTGQAIEFLTRDTTVTIVSGNVLLGRASADGVARVLASGAGIQSIVRQLEVVPKPDSLVPQGTVDTLRLSLLGTAQENTSAAIAVKVLSIDTVTTTTKPVRSWIVSFSLEYQGAVVTPGDTTKIWLVNDAGRPSSVDTTDSQGLASRKVRYRVGTSVPPLDSALITASASYRGVPLAGSPVLRVLPIRPKS